MNDCELRAALHSIEHDDLAVGDAELIVNAWEMRSGIPRIPVDRPTSRPQTKLPLAYWVAWGMEFFAIAWVGALGLGLVVVLWPGIHLLKEQGGGATLYQVLFGTGGGLHLGALFYMWVMVRRALRQQALG